MNIIALKMLIGDRAKYLAIIMGIVFASRSEERRVGEKCRYRW